MIIVTLSSIIALYLTFLNAKGVFRKGMLCGFILVTLVQGLRYDYGNDYMNYFRDFEKFKSLPLSLDTILDAYQLYNVEPGWLMINVLVSLFGGFFLFVLLITIIQSAIYYNFIKKNVQLKYWYISVFLYLFTTTTGYLINMTMMRQGFAITLFLLAFPYIRQRKWLPALIITLISGSMHLSALLLVPISFAGFINFRHNRIVALVLLIVFFVLLTSSSILKNIVSHFFLLDMLNYAQYEDSEKGSLGYGIMVMTIPFFVFIYLLYKKMLCREASLLLFLSCFFILIQPFAQVINIVSRVGYYFYALYLASVPYAYSRIIQPFRTYLYVIMILFIIWTYVFFFVPGSSIYAPYYLNYKTIFSVI